jgi:hypothetical protein
LNPIGALAVEPAELAHTRSIDHRSSAVRDFVAATGADREPDPVRRAVQLYYAVRDDIRYEIYGADLSEDGLSASSVATVRKGMCIHKSVLYAAALRAVGIPSRLMITDVRNHLVSPQLKRMVGDVFHYHTLTVLRPAGRWIRATPVFNRRLCRLYDMEPLEFDGRTDSMHHPFDGIGRKHMEFVRFHGDFDDLPYRTIIDGMRRQHPAMFAGATSFRGGSSLVSDAISPRSL